jgi:hypothetical protein
MLLSITHYMPFCCVSLGSVSQFMYCYAECHYAECHYAECGYAECRYAECRYAECRDADTPLKWVIAMSINQRLAC